MWRKTPSLSQVRRPFCGIRDPSANYLIGGSRLSGTVGT
jgi:hypothetical protein